VQRVVGADVELPCAGPTLGAGGSACRWDIDIKGAAIRIDFTEDASYGGGASLTFSDLDPVRASCPGTMDIMGIEVLTNFPVGQLDVASLTTFAAHSVDVQFAPSTGVVDWAAGQFIEVRLSFGDCVDWSSAMFDPDANFYDVQASANAFFAAADPPDGEEEEEEGDLMFFQRWQSFWRPRVDTVGSDRSGSFHYATAALLDYLQSPNLLSSRSSDVLQLAAAGTIHTADRGAELGAVPQWDGNRDQSLGRSVGRRRDLRGDERLRSLEDDRRWQQLDKSD
jgi:hypothetical protein